MSYLRLEDHADGVRVFFTDSTFVSQQIATLTRADSHTIKFETTFVKGDDNDVVRIFIDGEQKMRGASWENYYRSSEERNPSPSDRLLIRTAGTAAPATLGSGFLFDNVTSTSSHVDNPAPLNPPAPGPAGENGTNGTNGTNGVDGEDGTNGANGTNGVNGKDGVNGTTTIIRDQGVIAGASMRTLRVRNIKGMDFISARASLRGKRLAVQRSHDQGRSPWQVCWRVPGVHHRQVQGQWQGLQGSQHPEPEHHPQVVTNQLDASAPHLGVRFAFADVTRDPGGTGT